MARRNSPAEDLIEIVAKWPWWVGIVLAIFSYLIFGAYAGDPASPFTVFVRIGQFALPMIFLFGSGLSFFSQRRKNKLFEQQADQKSLNDISWAEFEMLVEEVYRRKGYSATQTAGGADGGIDVVLEKQGQTFLVQCKQWKNRQVGVKVIRELAGVVKMRKAAGGIVVASGQFTSEAMREAKVAGIELLDGPLLSGLIKNIQEDGAPSQVGVMLSDQEHTKEAHDAPACPSCSTKMVLRTAKRGRNKGGQFWGCPAYPKCKGTLSA